MLGPDALAWRDRHYGQSSCPQGRRRARENRGNRRNAAAPTPLFSRSQSDRAVLRKTQSSPAQVLRALHPRPLGSNRNNPPGLHSRRVQQLLHTRRIWAKMRGIRSNWFDLYKAFERMRDDINRALGQHNEATIGWPDTDFFTESSQVHRHSRAKKLRYD